MASQTQQFIRQRQQLSSRRQQLGSASAIRNISRESRQLQLRRIDQPLTQIQQNLSQLQTTSRELTRLSQLPTRQELIFKQQSQLKSDLKLARRAISSKGIAIASLPKNIRSLVVRLREGANQQALLKEIKSTPTEEALGISLPASLRGLSVAEIKAGVSLAKISDLPKIDTRLISFKGDTTFEKVLSGLTEGPQFRGETIVDISARRGEKPKGEVKQRIERILPTPKPKEEIRILKRIDDAFILASKPFLLAGGFISDIKIPATAGTVGSLITPRSLEEVGFSEREAEEFISTTLKFAVFAPFLSAAAAKKASTKQKQVTKEKPTKTAGVRFGKSEIESAEEGIRQAFLKGQNERIRDALRTALRTGNKKVIRETEKLLKNSLGTKNANVFIKDIRAQELLIKQARPKFKPIKFKDEPSIPIKGTQTSAFAGKGLQFEFAPQLSAVPRIPQKGIVGIGASTALKNERRVIEAKAKNEIRVALARASPLQRELIRNQLKLKIGFASILVSKLSTAQAITSAQASQQEQRLKQIQQSSQASQQLLRQQQRVRQTQKFRLLSALARSQVLRRQQRARKVLRTKQIKKLKKRRGVLPSSSKKKLVKGKKKKLISDGAFDVFTFKKGKKTLLNKKPFLTREGGRDFGASRISKNLRASFFVKTSSRKGAKKAPKNVKGAFKKLRSQFRPSKNPARKGVFVEKRKFRLEKGGNEVREIKQAKRRKR